MKEKYFEDLGLDDGEEIFRKLKIDVDEILNKKDEKSKEKKESENK